MDVNDLKGLYAEVNKRMITALEHVRHELGGTRKVHIQRRLHAVCESDDQRGGNGCLYWWSIQSVGGEAHRCRIAWRRNTYDRSENIRGGLGICNRGRVSH